MIRGERAEKPGWIEFSIVVLIATVSIFLAFHMFDGGYSVRSVARWVLISGASVAAVVGLRRHRVSHGFVAFNLAAAASILVLMAASVLRDWGRAGVSQQYSGLYQVGFEVSSFETDDEEGEWWLRCAVPSCLDPAGHLLAVGRPVHLTVEAELSRWGSYGHMGAYNRELRVSKVIAATPFDDLHTKR